MKNKLTIFALLAFVCISAAVWATPPVYNGSLIVESKTVTSGNSFTVKLWLTGSDLDLTSLRIPLKFDNQYLACTYVDFSGSLKDAEMEGYHMINGGELEISYIPPVVEPLPLISADSGLIATLYFTVSGDTPDMTIMIDSIYEETVFEQFKSTFHLWRRPEVAEVTGMLAFVPSFVPGAIEVHRPTGIGDESNDILPASFELYQNRPNPFNPATTIAFALPEKAWVRLDVFNLLGQRVATLADGEFEAGNHEVAWNAQDAPSGVYFYRISAATKVLTKKMLLLK
ncbi:MAG: T9SS type A sorting domain-containing protein [Candidatus Zixiibacteriota bacterium]|nr:MAG: T9SS type A sorting domain-containing protein [candidate division Zixibacteria bacterium]